MMRLELDVPLRQIPHASNWLGAWAMQENAFGALQQQFEQLSIRAHLAQVDSETLLEADRFDVSIVNGVAIVSINGPMMKHYSSFGESCSTVGIRRQIAKLKRDAMVRGLILKIESPGGTVAGTMELAEDVAKFGKPTMAYCVDLTASAAYWVASQCDSISANTMAMVGSIGTYTVIVDSSKYAEKEGISVNVVRAGKYKGAGTAGTEITEEQLADVQRLINAVNTHFVAAVERGRGRDSETVVQWADGRVHMANDAATMGLIDSVETFEQAFERFESSLSTPEGPAASIVEESDDMANDTAKPVTAAELKERFPKSSAEWRLKAIENGWTMEQSVESYASLLEARAEAAEARAEAAERKAKRPGAQPVNFAKGNKRKFRMEEGMPEDEDMSEDGTEDMESEDDMCEESATAAWNQAVASAMKSTRGNRQRALSIANSKNPGLREAMLQEANAARRFRRR